MLLQIVRQRHFEACRQPGPGGVEILPLSHISHVVEGVADDVPASDRLGETDGRLSGAQTFVDAIRQHGELRLVGEGHCQLAARRLGGKQSHRRCRMSLGGHAVAVEVVETRNPAQAVPHLEQVAVLFVLATCRLDPQQRFVHAAEQVEFDAKCHRQFGTIGKGFTTRAVKQRREHFGRLAMRSECRGFRRRCRREAPDCLPPWACRAWCTSRTAGMPAASLNAASTLPLIERLASSGSAASMARRAISWRNCKCSPVSVSSPAATASRMWSPPIRSEQGDQDRAFRPARKDRRGIERLPRSGRKPFRAAEHGVPDAARQGLGVACFDQLAGEEGIAFGRAEHGGRIETGFRRKERHGRLAQQRHLHATHGSRGDFSEGLPQPPLPLGRLVACGEHQEDIGAGDPPPEKPDQVERCAVGPMHVLDDQHGRQDALAQSVQQFGKELQARTACSEQWPDPASPHESGRRAAPAAREWRGHRRRCARRAHDPRPCERKHRPGLSCRRPPLPPARRCTPPPHRHGQAAASCARYGPRVPEARVNSGDRKA